MLLILFVKAKQYCYTYAVLAANKSKYRHLRPTAIGKLNRYIDTLPSLRCDYWVIGDFPQGRNPGLTGEFGGMPVIQKRMLIVGLTQINYT